MSDDVPSAGPESSVTPDKLRGRLAEDLREALARGESPSLRAYAKKYGLAVAEVGRILDGLRAMAASVGDDRPAAPLGPPPLPEDYEVLGELGRGAMGVVYRARQRSLGRVVAVKVLRPGDALFVNLADRFRREVQALAKLRHPHIVAVHEVGEAGGHLFFAMDLVEGRSLHELVASGEMTPTRAVKLLTQVASAIAYTHGHGLVHRDLKPGNILVDEKDDAFVVDFGLARDTAIEAQLTGTGQILGTPAYMSPEQAKGDTAAIGEATDVYALGAVLYECLTRRAPFEGKGLAETIRAVAQDEPVAPRRIDARIPRDLEVICRTAMAKEPQRRYPSAQAFQEDLERFVEGLPIRARPASAPERLRRWAKRNPAVAASAAGTFVVLVAALGVTLGLLAETTRERNEKTVALKDRDHALIAERTAREATTKESAAKSAALARAEANLAVARAMAALERDPGTAVVLAREAVRRAPTSEANSVLLDALARNREVRRFEGFWTSFELIVALDACAAVVAPGSTPGHWIDPARASAAAVLEGLFPSHAAASPDRRSVAVSCAGRSAGGIVLLDPATLAVRARYACDATADSLTFSRDGRTLVAVFGPYLAASVVATGHDAPAGEERVPTRVVALDASTLQQIGFIDISRTPEACRGVVEDVTAGRFFVWSDKTLLAWTPGSDPSDVALEGAKSEGFAIRGCVADGARVLAVVSTPTTVNNARGLALRAIDLASGATVGRVDVRGEKTLLSPAGNALLAFGDRDVVGFADLVNFRAVERKLRVHTSGGSYEGVRDSLPLGSAFTRDGALVALAGGEKGDGGVWVGDPVTGESRVEIEGDFGGLSEMRFLHEDRWLAAGEYGLDNHALHVWNVRGPAAVGPCGWDGNPEPAKPPAKPARPAAGGKHAWTITNDAIVDDSDGTRRPVQFADGARTVEGIGWTRAYVPGGRLIALAEAAGTGSVLFVDSKDLRVVRRWDVGASIPHEAGRTVWPSELAFDRAGTRLAVRAALGAEDEDAASSGCTEWWAVLDLATSTTRTGRLLDERVPQGVGAFGLSPDGRRVLESSDRFVRVWDVETGAILADLSPRADAETKCNVTTFGASGATVAVGTRQGVVAVYESDRLRRTFTALTQLGLIVDVTVSPDGTLVLARDLDGRTELWRLADGARVVRVPDRLRSISTRFTADGTAVVMAGRDTYWRWPLDLLGAADEFVCSIAAMPQWERGPVRDAGRAELRALEIVDGLRSRRVRPTRPFREDLASAIDEPGVFPDDLRAAARVILAKMGDDAQELNGLAWEVAVNPRASAEEYRVALAYARRAAALSPGSGSVLNTLGVAQYRAGDFPAAAETLAKSNTLNDGNDVRDLAFLAMAQWRLGRKDEARRSLGLLREAMKDERDAQCQAFHREAEETLAE